MAEKKGVGHAYNIDFLNVVFAASSLFLFLSVIWMVWDDYDREWKNTQRRFAQLEYQVTQALLQQAGRAVDRSKLQQLEALTNVNLSEYIWVWGLRTGLPSAWYVREIFGILLVLFYVFALPVILAKAWFRGYYEKLGGPRYYVTTFLFLMMMALPIKMLLRWIVNLKYIVAIPEFFFNI